MSNLENAKIYRRVGNSGTDQYAAINLDATNFCVTLDNQVYTISNRFNNINTWAAWKHDAEGHVTVATPYASTDAANKGYVDDNYVSLTRSETIQGLKTFERRPRVTVGAVQYTYLQSQGYSVLGTACPYIDTGIKLTSTQNMLVEYDVEITSNEAAFIAGIDGATGVGSNDSNYWYLGTAASTSSVNTHTRQTIYELIRITSTTKRAAILNSSLTEIGARTGASIATYAMNTTYPIFAIKNNSDTVLQNNSKHSAGAKIYSVKIYVGAPESASELHTSAYLVAEYIPAKLGEANGFYDSVNHYFIPSANVYAFDIGEEVGPIDSSYENVALMSDLPAVGEGTLTIQRNGSYVGQFNANTVADATINIEVPTTLNDLTGWSTIGTSAVNTIGVSTVVNDSSTDSQIPTARAVRLAIQNLAPNQNAWSYIKVGNATISAASETDTFEVAAGTAATVAADTTNKKVTIGVSLGTGASQAAKGDHNHDSVYSKLGHNHDSAYAALGHTHTTSLSTSTATPSITLDYSGKYAITAGGTTYTFQMPAQYSLPSASASAYGGVKVGYTTSGKNYKLQLDSSGNAYVNVPWSDTNYYHTAGSWSSYAYTLTGNGGAGNITITLPTVVSTIGVAATGLYVATNGGVTTTIGSVIGTTAVSTKTISTNSASIASGNTDLVTGGAIYSYVENEGGKVKSVKVNGTTYNPEAGVITLPNYPVIPTNVSVFTNDAGYLTQHQAIPSIKSATLSWGTAVEYGNNVSGTSVKLTMPAKPSYTAGDVGALPSTTAFLAAIGKSDNTYTITKSDSTTVSWTIPTIPSNVSAFTNDAGYLTTVAWGDVTNKPTTFTPSAHSHPLNEITGVSTISTTAVSTKTISTSSASIASGNADLVTGGAIYSYVENEGGKVKSLTVGSTNYTPTNGVITIPAYPSVSDSTITIKQDGQSAQTFTLNGSAKTINLADTNTWRPLGTGATDAAAGNHGHTSFNGLLINTQTNTTPFNISRTGNLAENVAYGVTDGTHHVTYTNDETYSSINWTLINTDTESGGGASASTHTMALSSSNAGMSLTIDGTAVSLNGHTHSQYLTSQSNDFGKIKVGSTTTTASAIQDVITFAAGGDLGVSISGKTITYSVTLPTELPASDVSAWAKAANKPTYTASEVGALPSTTSYLAAVNNSGNTYTITNSAGSKISWTIPTTLPASDVSAWAKAANKPTYTWTEIDNKPTTFTPSAHNHPLSDITGVATIGTTTVSTSTITTTIGSSTSSTNIPTEGAIVAALSNVSIKPTVDGDTIIFK